MSKEPWRDPIVEEVREAGRRIFEDECGGDLHRFFERLRKIDKELGDRVRTPSPDQSLKNPRKKSRKKAAQPDTVAEDRPP